jgi:farnesyl-diphosphate farnesyltransferase
MMIQKRRMSVKSHDAQFQCQLTAHLATLHINGGWQVDICGEAILIGVMAGRVGKQVLKGVSRSFYLSLRLLPQPMREAASLGYLLARTSDTLADTATVAVELRLECIRQFQTAIAEKSIPPRWPVTVLNAIPDRRERHLLECAAEIFTQLVHLPEAEAELVREVITHIISGQTLDLQRFAAASRQQPVALASAAELEDYAWRVAGSVGAFWTKLGFLTLGERFSTLPEPELITQGIAYGKGLQLVNILRDVAADLAMGRCYLPVSQPIDIPGLLDSHGRWLDQAKRWLGEGEIYATSLPSRRLRAATILPGRLALRTLEPLSGVTWEALQTRIKISRRAVYQEMIRAFFSLGR